MTSLNHIPDHLRDRRRDDDHWSPRRALIVGSIWTVVAAIPLGALSCAMGYYTPTLTTHWALAALGMFVVTSMLHAVMYRASNMVTNAGSAVAFLLSVVVLVCTHVALCARFASLASPPSSAWTMFTLVDLFAGHATAWVGLLAATFWCKDGASAFEPLVWLLSRNSCRCW